MDANGLKFWLLADEAHWHLPGEPPALEYDAQRRSLRLARQRREQTLAEDREASETRLETVPQARDEHGNRAWWDAEWQRILAVGVNDTPRIIYSFTEEVTLTDMALADDGVLYMAVDGTVIMHDRRQRWRDAVVSADDFSAWHLSPVPGGGCWVLDRDDGKLARLTGYPISDRAHKPYTPETVRPCHENADPPRLMVLDKVAWPATEAPVALACSLHGKLVVLSWVSDSEAVLRQLTEAFELSSPMTLLGTHTPYSLAWIARGRVAVLVGGETTDETPPRARSEARVYRVDADVSAQFPSGDLYPLKRDYDFGPFIHGLDYPPHYPAFTTSHPLHRLSFPFFTRQGEAYNTGLHMQLDSTGVDSVWHRLYIEASIPTACGVRIWLAASNEVKDHIRDTELQWFEHRFGERYQQGAPSDVPVGSWMPQASELPHHPGLLPCDSEAGRKGLFTALIQRAGLQVRNLRGRYLYVKVELCGPGNATPELFAARAYASRFSYVEHYLPRLYREQTFAPEADETGTATPADFLERYLNNIEGLFTMIEDRVAYSDLVTRPQTVPSEALEWLSDWIGFQFEAAWSEAQRRRFLENAAELYRWHGTLRGLNLALEIATAGGVNGGEIVVLEDYRLRRTFATIIGADLDDDRDPLTLGGIETGNSFVGDTLFIGDEQRREFLALFCADLEVSGAEQSAIDTFFDRLAFRVTILVHQNVAPQDLGMIQRMAEREVPAHVQFRILTTSAPLLAGITSLVGVDTYLSSRPEPGPARINRSHVGHGDYVMGPATLDSRLEGIGAGVPQQRPIARAEDVTAAFGDDFTLDGSDSEAPPGRSLVGYRWSFLDRDNNGGDNT
ncbi:MAG: phage tail protein [Gammaproteobacteria bacterium]|nr:phage tail protein [Gammaproteobacteria bacterium]